MLQHSIPSATRCGSNRDLFPGGVLTFGAVTDTGKARSRNEDGFATVPEVGLFVVTDGVSRSPAAAAAARVGATTMSAYVEREAGAFSPLAEEEGPFFGDLVLAQSSLLYSAAVHAHRRICEHGIQHKCWGLATTMAALWLVGDHAIVANAGDSRIYRLSACRTGLDLLTRDHTALQDYLDQFGRATKEIEREMGHVVTRVLGGRDMRPPEIELSAQPIGREETFVLCTDGLTNLVSEQEIALILARGPTPQLAAEALVSLANHHGGHDNVTAIVVSVRRQA